MKNTITLFLSMVLVFSACNTSELTDLNINPNTVNTIDPEFMLANAQLLNNTHIYSLELVWYYVPGYVQHFAAVGGVFGFGDKYLNNRPEDLYNFYTSCYTNAVADITDVIRTTKDDPKQLAVNSIARIMRVFIMHRLTDFYGDIVYFDGGAGFSSNVLLPKFDKQQEIYADMLKELEESVLALSSSSNLSLKTPTQDLYYSGDKGKWVKFANALMLRLGMRMSKADPAAAKQWVAKAVAGGLMTSNEDNTTLIHTNGPNEFSRNPISIAFESVESEGQKLSKTFIDWLKNNEDPRLMIYTMGIGPATGPFNTNPIDQKGMPNGYNEETIKEYEGVPPEGEVDIHTMYSTVNKLLVSRTSPSIYMTYAEVELLLAEASQLQFIAGSAADHYNAAVRAAMTMYSKFDPSLSVSDGDISAYLAAHPYDPNVGLKMIGEQYWAINFTNPTEAWANWRRTGFPVLTPVDYEGPNYNNTIPRRFQYPLSESATNANNYNEVVQRQGPDTWDTRMWWDKQ